MGVYPLNGFATWGVTWGSTLGDVSIHGGVTLEEMHAKSAKFGPEIGKMLTLGEDIPWAKGFQTPDLRPQSPRNQGPESLDPKIQNPKKLSF